MPEAILPEVIDASMISSFKTCPRRFFNNYVLGLTPFSQNLHLTSGSAIASALEHYYASYFKHHSHDLAIIAAYRTFSTIWGDLVPYTATPKTFENCWNCVAKYFEIYPPETDPFQLLFLEEKPAVEFTFSIALDEPWFPRHPVTGNPFLYAGRLDAFGTYNNVLTARDEKTTTSLSEQFFAPYQTRGQFLGAIYSLRRLGYDISHFLVRGISIQKDPVFQERHLFYSDYQVEEWEKSLIITLHQLVSMWKVNYFSPNLSDGCKSFNSPCVYLDLCTVKPSPLSYSIFDTKRWNPLNHGEE